MRVIAAISAICAIAVPASGEPFTLSNDALLDGGFDVIWRSPGSTSSLDARRPGGSGVEYDLTLAGDNAGKMGIGDPWPTSSAVGLLWDDGLNHYTSLAGYSSYSMSFSYLAGPSDSTIDIGLFMNTGLTGPSGYPSLDTSNDTYWGGDWVSLSPGETALAILDFDAATAHNITDNPEPHTGGGLEWPDGMVYSINKRDLNEISNIGFDIADYDGDASGEQLSVGMNIVPEPATITGCLLGFVALTAFRRRR